MTKHKHQAEENPELNQSAGTETEAENAIPPTEEPVEGMAERLSRLERELADAQQAKDESNNRILRLQADFDNFRRRSRQEYEQVCLYAGEDLVKKILPVLDSLERAVRCFSGDCPAGWQEGVQLTLKQFQDILTTEGLEAIPAENADFDPQVHEAISQEATGEVETAKVVAELQKGYKYKGRVIRPALVKVAIPG